MAKKERLAISAGNARESAKESMIQRALRIDGSCNGTTLRTRVIRNKKLYNRNIKHRKSFAEAGDFSHFMGEFRRLGNTPLGKSVNYFLFTAEKETMLQ